MKLVSATLLALAVCLAVCLTGCQSSAPTESESAKAIPAAAPAPWTNAFQAKAVLIADTITIEGPDDLVEHVATTQGPGITYRAETRSTGLVEFFEVTGTTYVRAQLDGWEMVATKRLTILRRPDLDGPLRLIANGEVYWTDPASKREERVPERTWVGQRGR